MTSLTNPNNMHSIKLIGKNRATLVDPIEQTTRKIVEIGYSTIERWPDDFGNNELLNKMHQAVERVKDAGELNIYCEL